MSNKERKNDKAFSSTEVGVLIEDLKSNFNIVAEETRGLSDRMGAVENRLVGVEESLTGVERRLTHVEDAVRLAVPSLFKRVSALEAKAGV